MMVLQRLEDKLIDTAFVVLGGLMVWYITGRLTASAIAPVTAEAGEALARLTQALNGSYDVEFTPIVFRSHYFKSDYTLTDEADRVLWQSPQNHAQLIEVFGVRGAPMKAEYRALIKQSN